MDKRITDLEIRFSFQDDFLFKLNAVVTEQNAAIHRLEKEVLDLKRAINPGSIVDGTRTLSEDKPPHY